MPRTARAPEFLFEPAAFLNDPAVLPMRPAEVGAYAVLLLNLWFVPEPGVVPDDDRLLSSLSRSGAEWPDLRPAVARCFDTASRPGYWVQRRMVRTHRAQVERFKRNQQQGREAAISRWSNAKDAARKGSVYGEHADRIAADHASKGLGSGSTPSEAQETLGVLRPMPPSAPALERGEWSRGFETFWEKYPADRSGKKPEKKAALAAWFLIRPKDPATLDAIVAGVDRYRASRTVADGYVLYAARWLKRERWKDEDGAARSGVEDWAREREARGGTT